MIIPPNSSKPTLMKQSGRVDAMSEGLTSGAQKKSRRCDADTSGWRWTERVCGGGGLTLTWIQPGSTPEAGDAVWRRRRRRLLFLLGDGVHFAWIVFQAHGRQRRLGRRCRRHRRWRRRRRRRRGRVAVDRRLLFVQEGHVGVGVDVSVLVWITVAVRALFHGDSGQLFQQRIVAVVRVAAFTCSVTQSQLKPRILPVKKNEGSRLKR